MPTLLNPYLHFPGTAREALDFYRSVFGGDLDVMTYGEMGMDGDQAAQVMHGQLTAPSLTLMASDGMPGEELVRGNTSNLSLSGDDETELRGWFDRLADGGEVHVPLEKQVWGDVFGQCADRFGVTWLVNIAQPG
ncbi:VOC family protein [Nocardioides dongkuii]|uniref:VOC family protein n=1 Tax=Nocardioides dongkuii TaxID=2760089 RepID=UPI0015FE3736|nr:VOC family protein [Nocardioides dongkuii]